MRNVQIQMPEGLITRLDEIAEINGVSRSAVVKLYCSRCLRESEK